MSEPFEFEIPGDPLVLSPNRRLHHMERARLTADWRARAWFAWVGNGQRQFTSKVRLHFTLRRTTKVDPDNALSSLKSCIDGLCDSFWHAQRSRLAMLPGDGDQWVEYAPVQQITGRCWKGKECVIVRVEPL